MWNLQSYPAIVLDERVWHFRGYLTPCTYFRNLKTPNYHHLHPCIFIRSNDLQENRDNKTVHKIISGFNSHNLRAAEYKGYTVSPMQSGCGISAGDVILRSGRMTRGGATVVSGGDWSTWRACLKPLDPQLSCPSLTHPLPPPHRHTDRGINTETGRDTADDTVRLCTAESGNGHYFVRRTTFRLDDRAFSVAAPPEPGIGCQSELKTTTCSIETSNRRLKTFYLILLLVLIRRDNAIVLFVIIVVIVIVCTKWNAIARGFTYSTQFWQFPDDEIFTVLH